MSGLIALLATCSREVSIEFRGEVYDKATRFPLPGVEVWSIAMIDGDTLAPFLNDHPAAISQGNGNYKDIVELRAGGCSEVSPEDFLRDGAYFKFQKSGYQPVDTFITRKEILRVSGYYRLPSIHLAPSPLKTSLNRRADGR